MEKKVLTPAARRDAVAYLVTTYEVSQRRACVVVRAPRSMVRYRHRRPDDAALRNGLKDLASERRRFGYRPQAIHGVFHWSCSSDLLGRIRSMPSAVPLGTEFPALELRRLAKRFRNRVAYCNSD
jgi:hypothetical protein